MAPRQWIAHWFRTFVLPKLRFAMTSSVATLVDYSLYLLLVYTWLKPVPSNIISTGVGMITNFLLQKRFVFLMKRDLKVTFIMSITFSVIAIGLSTLFIYLLTRLAFFNQHQYITKFIVTGTVFFYNFYTKRYAFEKTLPSFRAVLRPGASTQEDEPD